MQETQERFDFSQEEGSKECWKVRIEGLDRIVEERTFEFAKDVRLFVKSLDYTIANKEDSKQIIRSSGSIGANYIEANEALSKKDFVFRVKISRKESKESVYW